MEYRNIHIWGDSILKGIVFDEQRRRYAILRENCVAMLSAAARVKVINHARMGITAPEAERQMCDGDFSPGGLALFEFGGNDCDMPWAEIAKNPEGQFTPRTTIEQFAKALSGMVARARGAQMETMLVVPPPLDAPRYFNWVTQKLDQVAVSRHIGDVHHIYRWQERYAWAVTEVAARLKCPTVSLRNAFLDSERFEHLFCADGIHPSAEGHALMGRVLMEVCGGVA